MRDRDQPDTHNEVGAVQGSTVQAGRIDQVVTGPVVTIGGAASIGHVIVGDVIHYHEDGAD